MELCFSKMMLVCMAHFLAFNMPSGGQSVKQPAWNKQGPSLLTQLFNHTTVSNGIPVLSWTQAALSHVPQKIHCSSQPTMMYLPRLRRRIGISQIFLRTQLQLRRLRVETTLHCLCRLWQRSNHLPHKCLSCSTKISSWQVACSNMNFVLQNSSQ